MTCLTAPAVLAALVLQNTAMVLVTKHSFRDSAPQYNVAVVVLLSELLKICTCWVVICCNQGLKEVFRVTTDVTSNWKLALPAALYVIQNNAHFVAIQNLDTPVYVVCAQSKVLTTAFFAVRLLGKVLSTQQCVALLFLVVGMIIMQLGPDVTGDKNVALGSGSSVTGLLAVSIHPSYLVSRGFS